MVDSAGARAGRLIAAVAVAIAVGVASAATALASPSGAATTGPRAGYAVRPNRFSSVRLEFRVPAARCAADEPASAVEIGIFGKTRFSRDRTPWFASVTSSCRAGHSRYIAKFGNFNTVKARAVHHGDLIRISAHRGTGPSFTIRDLTTGQSLNGSVPVPPGASTMHRIVLGGRLTGPSPGHLRVAVTHCAVNGKAITAHRHQGEAQQRGQKIIARPTALSAGGLAFRLASS